jgi:rubredoxin
VIFTCVNPDCANYGMTWEDSPKEYHCPECGEEAEEVGG